MCAKSTILIVGSCGSIGSKIKTKLSHRYSVISDETYSLQDIINESFFLEHKVSIVINCIGAYRDEKNFFHSNFYLPYYLACFVNQLSLKLKSSIVFINMSSLGITAPYSRLSIIPLDYSPYFRSKVSLNHYEFSKLCFDTSLSLLPKHNYFKSCSLLVSNVLNGNKLPFSFLTFAFFSPFRLSRARTFLFSSSNDIYNSVSRILESHYSDLNAYNIIKAYCRYPAINYLPSVCFSFLKINPPKKFYVFLPSLSNVPIIGKFVRLFIFLYVL